MSIVCTEYDFIYTRKKIKIAFKHFLLEGRNSLQQTRTKKFYIKTPVNFSQGVFHEKPVDINGFRCSQN